jgi:hypothetical protein
MQASPTSQPPAEQSPQEIVQKVANDSEILYETRSVFPFDLFPDHVIVDKSKVSVIRKIFFLSEVVQSVPAKDILTVQMESSPFLARITIIGRMPQQAEIVINNLLVKDATKLRKVIQGLAIAAMEAVQIDTLPKNQQLQTVEEIGATNSTA